MPTNVRVTRAVARRLALLTGVAVIVAVAIGGTLAGRRSLADYSRARAAVHGDILRYEHALIVGESRARAVTALRTAGASVESVQGDIVVTVLRELGPAAHCRLLVGQLHVGIDAKERVAGWESPPLNAECD